MMIPLLLLAQVAATPAPPVRRIAPVKIVLVGDSTMQVGSGWGRSAAAGAARSARTTSPRSRHASISAAAGAAR